MLQQQPFVLEDFSGGITDKVLGAQPNQSADMTNYEANLNRKLLSAAGSRIYADTMYQIPDGNVRVTDVFSSASPNLFVASGEKIWYAGASSFTELTGPTSNPCFRSASVSNFTSHAEWNDHTFVATDSGAKPIKIFKNASSVITMRTAGLPALSTSPTCTPTAGANSYLYLFMHKLDYTVETVLYTDRGPTTQVTCASAAAIAGGNPVSITAIPTLSNGLSGNYDTTNLKIEIYRTIAGGTTFYKVSEVTNGTTTYSDTMTDATLILQSEAYTNGGALDNDPPPISKYITMVNGYMYYGHVTDGSEVIKNRVRQSLRDDPDSCPETSYVDLLDEIVGLSSYNDNPLVFTKNHVYRLQGAFTDLGQGEITYEDITKTVGCVSHNSIVQTRYGVFWAGDDGFYYTDGFRYQKVSDNINERYQTVVSSELRRDRIYGTYDSINNKVYWCVSLDESSSDNDSFLVLDLRWGIRDESTFYIRNNGTNFAPTAATTYGGQLIRVDRRGYVFKHDSDYVNDPRVDTTVAATSWTTASLRPTWKSTVLDYNAPMMRKWVSKILCSFKNLSATSIQITAYNDDTSTPRDLKVIRSRDNLYWNDLDAPNWNEDDALLWSSFNMVEEMRRFPAHGLRCSKQQIQVSTAYTPVYNSDQVSTATVNASAKTATLTNVSLEWPSDIVDYYISFETDTYANEYLVSSRTSDTVLTFLDPSGTAPNTTQKWVLRGYPKNERYEVISLSIYYSIISSQSFKTYRSEQDSTGLPA